MVTNTVIYEPTLEGITIITINRPEVRNAVNHATSLKLAEAFQRFENDAAQKVCILTGAGTNFCAGYDLHQVAANNSGELAVSPVDKVNGAFGPMGPSRMRLSKPLIAAISGHAVAGGLELSLLADLRVVDTTAVFGVFCRRFGVPLIDGGTVRLPKVVGQGRALDMILTGRPVDAQEALSFGLANRVVPKGQAVEAARELARSLLGFPQKCMRADLVSAHYSVYDAPSLEDALRFEFEKGVSVVAEESVHGARTFGKGAGRGGKFDKVKL
ncbi:enoyl-CoA hydratase/isomerase family protein [Beauveria brongniartii RCEF 3172]|uniref:Enoyl-CoA hydratase/isomerase family protein n=1 Tax=Beauveria brongniartii RCEF 3172 TaxID=1081107 RepID=A0A166YBF5_9HYPO|nr:enoyl-CoA hydratase/isomerase family protein [Beauveria brongniartii RCEF 3172]